MIRNKKEDDTLLSALLVKWLKTLHSMHIAPTNNWLLNQNNKLSITNNKVLIENLTGGIEKLVDINKLLC